VMDRAVFASDSCRRNATRTFDRVEHTSDVVTRTVGVPRCGQVTGIVRGVTAGVEFLLGNRGRKNGARGLPRRPVPQERCSSKPTTLSNLQDCRQGFSFCCCDPRPLSHAVFGSSPRQIRLRG